MNGCHNCKHARVNPDKEPCCNCFRVNFTEDAKDLWVLDPEEDDDE